MPQPLRRSASIESFRLSTRTERKVQRPQPSLMSIPPELRLRILGYLVNGGRAIDSDAAGHTCIHTGNGTRFYLHRRRLNCPCTELVWPLAVNKTLFAEAIPVLYSTTELHVCLPANGTFKFVKNEPTTVARKLPRYAYPHIRRIALIGCLDNISGLTSRDEGTGQMYDRHGFHVRAEELHDVVSLSRAENVRLKVPCILPGVVMAKAPGVIEASTLGTEIREKLTAVLDARVQALSFDMSVKDISDGV
ncbi:hypothetical protein TI39_contig414g00009 [Zymoseptoria brevis]|uniref:Uncharacterized protein n=1 Tax=Zymoseptoria brevis TaxID=1047168 RepID=A0A0F4GMT3_9PEZI|nr:hypothetical protein TI39_contig414g00009 [Zymoseptoria brevis]